MTIRRRIVDEILSTEATFVSSLQLLVEVYIEPLRKNQLISQNDITSIFSNLEMIYGFNKVLLEELEQAKKMGIKSVKSGQSQYIWKSKTLNEDNINSQEINYDMIKIGDIFKKYAPFFRMFSHYLSTFDRAIEYKAELAAKSKTFRSFLEDAKTHPTVNGADLLNFLIMPVQRVPRYKLLLQSLIDNTDTSHHDYNDLVKALELVSAAALHNNEHIRRQQNIEKLCEIQLGFEADTELNLFDSHQRTFIREGFLYKLSRTGKKKYKFWLLSDKILYGKKSILFSDQYTLHCEMDLQHVEIFDPINSEKIVPGKTSQNKSPINVDLICNNDWNLDISTSSSTQESDFEPRDSDLSNIAKLKIEEENNVIEEPKKMLPSSAEQITDHPERALSIANTFTGKTFTIWCSDSEDKVNWLKDFRSTMQLVEPYTVKHEKKPGNIEYSLSSEVETGGVNSEKEKMKNMIDLNCELKEQQKRKSGTNTDEYQRSKWSQNKKNNNKGNDNSIKCCEICEARFSVLLRRHHCYTCTKVICSNCSGYRSLEEYKNIQLSSLKLSQITKGNDENIKESVRICDACFGIDNQGNDQQSYCKNRRSGSFSSVSKEYGFNSLISNKVLSPKAVANFGDTEPSYSSVESSSPLPQPPTILSKEKNSDPNSRGSLLLQIREFSGTFRRKSAPSTTKSPPYSFERKTHENHCSLYSSDNKEIVNDKGNSLSVINASKSPPNITVNMIVNQMEKIKLKRASAPQLSTNINLNQNLAMSTLIPNNMVKERKESVSDELQQKFERIRNKSFVVAEIESRKTKVCIDDQSKDPKEDELSVMVNSGSISSNRETTTKVNEESYIKRDKNQKSIKKFGFNALASNRPSRIEPRSPISRRKSEGMSSSAMKKPISLPKRAPPPPPEEVPVQRTIHVSSGEDLMNSIKTFHSYETLIKPADELQAFNIDLTHKELYLEDSDFLQLFHVQKKIFLSFPKWKQDILKKQYKLF